MYKRRRKNRVDPRIVMIIGIGTLLLLLVRGCGIIFFGPQDIERRTVETLFEDERFPR